MADLPPNNPLPGTPTGAEPLKKSTGKVQPKKETVRISLPPKPSAAPTIKLPTLPPGGPTGAPSLAAAPTIAPRATAAPVAQRPAPTAQKAVPVLSMVDKILAIAAAVVALAAIGT